MRRLFMLVAWLPLVLAATALTTGEETDVTSFDRRAVDLSWQTVNDSVMGGRSRGGSAKVEGRLVFAGSTNTNGGGFSSIRAAVEPGALASSEGLELRVKGDGRTYTLLVRTDARYRRSMIWYRAAFETTRGAWTRVQIPFDRLQPRWRGRALSGPAFDPDRISGLGLMIYDKRDGAFRLEVDRVRTYAKQAGFSLATFRGKKRPLLVFAPNAADERLIEQVGDLMATQPAFEDRDMVLLVVLGEGASRVDGRPLSAGDADRLRRRHGVAADAFAVRLVGKDGGVKHEAAEPVALRSLYTLIDTMPMRRRELAERGR